MKKRDSLADSLSLSLSLSLAAPLACTCAFYSRSLFVQRKNFLMNEQAFLALVYRKPTATGLKNNVNSYRNVGLDIFICLFIFPLSIIILNKTHGRCTSYQEVLHFNSYLIIFCSFLLLVPLPLFSTEKEGEKARMRDRSNNWYSNLTLFFFIFQTPCALILLYHSLSLSLVRLLLTIFLCLIILFCL